MGGFNEGQLKRKYLEFIANAVDADLSARADRVVAAAKATTAFKDVSGDLRKSNRKKRFPNKRKPGYRITAGEGTMGNNGRPYAMAVELGHVGRNGEFVDPRPFLAPALQAARNEDG